MRILLIAYEFPPSPSPQSLRWAYLSRELHRLGHEVHVLTIDLGGSQPGLPELPAGIRIHRTHPGPVRGLVARRRRRRARRQEQASAGTPGAATPPAQLPSRGGWKHRVSILLQRAGEHIWFPDLRGEWHRFGRARLVELLATLTPDVVISSHEPATTLELGLEAKRAGVRWIADLADPVLAHYTLPRWHERARRLEASVCELADHVLVTTPAAERLLRERHPGQAPIHVLTQGFDAAPAIPAADDLRGRDDVLELLYTGSFYSFRTADSLLQAVLATPGTRLNIATIHVPDDVLAAARAHPERIRLLGFLPHLQALAWQRRADVLVNLANRDPSQVPGKCYEYLGAGRPILHLGDAPDDAVAGLITTRRRGWVCAPTAQAVGSQLAMLRERQRSGALTEGLALDPAAVAEFSWSALARRLDRLLREPAPV
jgi:glycosyltransferase involved in cell wall biosynthesis